MRPRATVEMLNRRPPTFTCPVMALCRQQCHEVCILAMQPAAECMETDGKKHICAADCTWNAHSIGSQIPKPQNAAAISHYNDLHIVAGPIPHDLIEAALLTEC